MDVLVQVEGVEHAITNAGPDSKTAVHWTRAVVLPACASAVWTTRAPRPMDPRSHLHGVYHAVVRRWGEGFEVSLRLELVDEGMSDTGPTRSFVSEVVAHAYAIAKIGDMIGTGAIAFGSILGQEQEHWMNRRIAGLAGGPHRAG